MSTKKRFGEETLRIEDLKPVVRRRMSFIEFSLNWEGRVGRPQLQEQFDISPQQATLDLNAYIDIFPNQMSYDPRQKAYIPNPGFRPRIISEKSSEYLTRLEALTRGYQDAATSWIQSPPATEFVAVRPRAISREILFQVLFAIQNKVSLKARYVSLASESESERTLLPHALASDGHRWHCRCFDVDKERYSDFVLSRLEFARADDRVEVQQPPDTVWDTFVDVLLCVDTNSINGSPDSKARQKHRLEHEYGMENETLKLTVRQALLFYYLRNLGFSPGRTSSGHMRNESSFHLKIKNLETVEDALNWRS